MEVWVLYIRLEVVSSPNNNTNTKAPSASAITTYYSLVGSIQLARASATAQTKASDWSEGKA